MGASIEFFLPSGRSIHTYSGLEYQFFFGSSLVVSSVMVALIFFRSDLADFLAFELWSLSISSGRVNLLSLWSLITCPKVQRLLHLVHFLL